MKFNQYAASLLLLMAPAAVHTQKPQPKPSSKPPTLNAGWDFKRRYTSATTCAYTVSGPGSPGGFVGVNTKTEEFTVNDTHIDKKDPRNIPAEQKLLKECRAAQQRKFPQPK